MYALCKPTYRSIWRCVQINFYLCKIKPSITGNLKSKEVAEDIKQVKHLHVEWELELMFQVNNHSLHFPKGAFSLSFHI